MHLKTYMHQHGLSKREAARSIGVAHSTLWRILNGFCIPNANTRTKIAQATRGAVSERDLLLSAAYAIGGACDEQKAVASP